MANNNDNTVTVSAPAVRCLGKYAVGKGPFGVAAEGANVWVTNYFGKSVTKLRAADGLNLGTFKVGDGAAGIVFDGTSLWVVNNGDSTVMKLSPSSGSVIATYATGKGPFSVAFDGSRIWVPNFGSNSVSMTAANYDLKIFSAEAQGIKEEFYSSSFALRLCAFRPNCEADFLIERIYASS